MTEKRKKLAIILLAVVAVLAVLYFAVLSPLLRTDEPADETQLLPGELMDSSGYIMMFERIEQSNISSISVHNSYGDWEMYKASDGNFYIRDHESVPYNKSAFSSLVVAAGYSATLGRVSDSCTGDALEEYGLTGDCSYYVIKSVGGAEYKVYIGDLIPTAGGYYARLEGRDAVYIIASDARTTLLAPVNAMAHSMVTYPLSSTKYYAVKDFYIMRGDDMKIWVDYTANEDGTGGYDTKAPQGYNASSDTLGTILSKFTEFAGKGADLIPGRVDGHGNQGDFPGAIGNAHAADDILAKLMQKGVDGFRGGVVFHHDADHGDTVFHGAFLPNHKNIRIPGQRDAENSDKIVYEPLLPAFCPRTNLGASAPETIINVGC